MHGRRAFLSSSLAAGAAASAPIFVRDRALGASPPAKLNDIDHFIIVMQENRSFDQYFGSLSGVRGFEDARGLQLENGASIFRQPDPFNPDGFTLPFHLDTTTTSAQQLHDLSHAWDA